MSEPSLYLGCISGTSVDGLDMALMQVGQEAGLEQLKILAAHTATFDDQLQNRLLELGQPDADDIDLLGACDRDLGIFIAEQLLAFLADSNVAAKEICAIGSHGQTIRHRPPSDTQPLGYSLQIGDASHIAERTGIQTVADFRRRDVAAGGQGAPLVPPFHAALFAHLDEQVAVLNIGGISNLSLLSERTTGFDSGPGNALLDSWHSQHRDGMYDEAGRWAASGQIDEALLATCLNDPYFQLAPPKSTGREYFNLAWLTAVCEQTNATPADIQATLCELTARCSTDALAKWAPQATSLIVCGGGRLNSHLMQRLAHHSSANVGPSEQWDVDGDSIEAALFAWLAHRTLSGQPGNEPGVTGAKGYRVLGVIHPA